MTIMFLGLPGSGKSSNAVKWMMTEGRNLKTYSNIVTYGVPNNIPINSSMIIKKEVIGQKKNGETIFKSELNKEFWMNLNEPVNVIIDEAHSVLFNSRRAMTKNNIIASDWLAMIRRVLGEASFGTGELILISQLSRRLDIIAKEMTHQIRYFKCHYSKICKKCNTSWNENNEMPEKIWECPRCGSDKITKFNFQNEVLHFQGIEDFNAWKECGYPSFYSHYMVTDIEKYFNKYNTLQWENLFD